MIGIDINPLNHIFFIGFVLFGIGVLILVSIAWIQRARSKATLPKLHVARSTALDCFYHCNRYLNELLPAIYRPQQINSTFDWIFVCCVSIFLELWNHHRYLPLLRPIGTIMYRLLCARRRTASKADSALQSTWARFMDRIDFVVMTAPAFDNFNDALVAAVRIVTIQSISALGISLLLFWSPTFSSDEGLALATTWWRGGNVLDMVLMTSIIVVLVPIINFYIDKALQIPTFTTLASISQTDSDSLLFSETLGDLSHQASSLLDLHSKMVYHCFPEISVSSPVPADSRTMGHLPGYATQGRRNQIVPTIGTAPTVVLYRLHLNAGVYAAVIPANVQGLLLRRNIAIMLKERTAADKLCDIRSVGDDDDDDDENESDGQISAGDEDYNEEVGTNPADCIRVNALARRHNLGNSSSTTQTKSRSVPRTSSLRHNLSDPALDSSLLTVSHRSVLWEAVYDDVQTSKRLRKLRGEIDLQRKFLKTLEEKEGFDSAWGIDPSGEFATQRVTSSRPYTIDEDLLSSEYLLRMEIWLCHYYSVYVQRQYEEYVFARSLISERSDSLDQTPRMSTSRNCQLFIGRAILDYLMLDIIGRDSIPAKIFLQKLFIDRRRLYFPHGTELPTLSGRLVPQSGNLFGMTPKSLPSSCLASSQNNLRYRLLCLLMLDILIIAVASCTAYAVFGRFSSRGSFYGENAEASRLSLRSRTMTVLSIMLVVGIECFILETFECIWLHCIIPWSIFKEINNAISAIRGSLSKVCNFGTQASVAGRRRSSMMPNPFATYDSRSLDSDDIYTRDRQSDFRLSGQDTTIQSTNVITTSVLNAAEYFFISYKMALKYPNLLESNIVKSFISHLPSDYYQQKWFFSMPTPEKSTAQFARAPSRATQGFTYFIGNKLGIHYFHIEFWIQYIWSTAQGIIVSIFPTVRGVPTSLENSGEQSKLVYYVSASIAYSATTFSPWLPILFVRCCGVFICGTLIQLTNLVVPIGRQLLSGFQALGKVLQNFNYFQRCSTFSLSCYFVAVLFMLTTLVCWRYLWVAFRPKSNRNAFGAPTTQTDNPTDTASTHDHPDYAESFEEEQLDDDFSPRDSVEFDRAHQGVIEGDESPTGINTFSACNSSANISEDSEG